MMKTELFYFDDCPSYKQAAANLKEALRLEGLPETVEMVEVASEEDAPRKRFIGSPSIRINGVDLEGPEAESNGYGYGCRVYSNDGSFAGWPSVERIRSVLRKGTPGADLPAAANEGPAEAPHSCCG